jgi:hypothetical protein
MRRTFGFNGDTSIPPSLDGRTFTYKAILPDILILNKETGKFACFQYSIRNSFDIQELLGRLRNIKNQEMANIRKLLGRSRFLKVPNNRHSQSYAFIILFLTSSQ